jgi:DIS3-like exonuclease 2
MSHQEHGRYGDRKSGGNGGGRGGGRGGGGDKQDHHAKNEKEDEAMAAARGAADAAGVHHRHYVNKGLDERGDSASHPLPTGTAYPGMAMQGAKTPTTTTGSVQRPPVTPYKSDPNCPEEVGIRDGTHVVGRLQLKQWTNAVAFVKNPLFAFDVFVGGVDHRGPALPGDIVVVKLKPQSEWKAAQREGVDSEYKPFLHAAPAKGTDDGSPASAASPALPDGRAVENVLRHDPSRRGAQDDASRLARALNARENLEWPANLQPEGTVVKVLERRFDPMQCCRFFDGSRPQQGEPTGPKQPPRIELDRWYRFKSYSDDFPIVAVYGRDIPANFRDDVTSYLFLVQVGSVPDVKFVDGRFPVGRVVISLGQAGTAEAESTAISFTHKVRDAPFSAEVEECVMEHFVIPSKEELKQMNRRDLRDEEFICTIDPATARDLDDALSIEQTPGGYRVGVHIADVSFFVPIHSPLDEEARERATSTYYIERVVPMLPRKLCEDYCSLNAGVDKFAFSGIWHFDRAGNVQSEWFGQSVIRNRCRMAYEDAQRIIEGDLSGDSLNFVNEEQPRDVLVKKVIKSVQLLQELALVLRQNRFDRGALSLNKGKLKFIFEDFNSRLAPKGLTQERSREANFLVEEFMLHANCRVGEKVVQYMPDSALLRKHDPPVKKKLNNFITAASRFGFKIQGGGSKALRDSLAEYNDHPDCDSLRFMATICMSLAKYTCSEEDKKASVGHYALAAPIYTHFTSPIRRYADLVIHRQLLLALDIERELKRRGIKGDAVMSEEAKYVDFNEMEHGDFYMHPSDVQTVALNCNNRKEAAKKAGDASSSLFLCLFIRALEQKAKVEPSLPSKLVLRAVVVRITDQVFTLYISDIALTYEIYHNTTLQKWTTANVVDEDQASFLVTWGQHPDNQDVVTEKLTLFSQVLVTLDAVIRGHMELQATIHAPWARNPARITPLDFAL